MMAFRLQELIHRFEEGAGARVVRMVLLVVALVTLAVVYDVCCFRNLATSEAMDAAQLGRNLAQGRGFTTQLVRPLSIHLVSAHRADHSALLTNGHPDIANAPLYPLLLAGVSKVVPPQDMTAIKNFSVARSDLAIAALNQVLLLIAAILLYRLARKWFDRVAAVMSVLLFAFTELYWRFSVSGLSTNLLLVFVLLLASALTAMEEASRNQRGGRVLLFAAFSGLLLGAMMLTRYACAFLVLPTILFCGFFLAQRRGAAIVLVAIVFIAVAAPWIARNVMVCGVPFGTATLAPMEQTRLFPEDRLQHTLHPDIRSVPLSEYLRKLVVNAREVVAVDLPRLGGSWVSAFFLVGLLVRFRSPALSRMRWFVLMALVTSIPVQALGKTHLWTTSPEVTSENLLVLLSPLTLIFGVGVFFVLLDSFEFANAGVRYAAWTAFAAVVSLPFLLAFLPPRPSPIVYPPYYPPGVQVIARWLDTNTLTMTDIPGAMAWYGNRQAVLTTTSWRDEFAEINDFQKPINCLYLTPVTLEAKFMPDWLRGETNTWQSFMVDVQVKQEVPGTFPLRRGVQGYLAEAQLVLMDYDRWRRTTK